MQYTPLQDKLNEALKKFNETMYTEWQGVVDAVNEYNAAMEKKEAHYDTGFPPEIEREMNHGAHFTAWIYMKMEEHVKPKRNTARKIRKAMGMG